MGRRIRTAGDDMHRLKEFIRGKLGDSSAVSFAVTPCSDMRLSEPIAKKVAGRNDGTNTSGRF